MKTIIFFNIICSFFLCISCKKDVSNQKHVHSEKVDEKNHNETTEHDHSDIILLTKKQVDYLQLDIRKLKKQQVGEYINASGTLSVAPQFESIITPFIGANIKKILVNEGDRIKKGEVLGFIEHPDLISIQTQFIEAHQTYLLLDIKYKRHKNLFSKGVISKEQLQEIQKDYFISKGNYAGLKAKLKLLHLNVKQIRQGKIQSFAPIKSPISGYVETVFIKIGQYVNGDSPLFELVNSQQVHIDLQIYQQDISKIRNKQKVKVTIPALDNASFSAQIYALSKSFEMDKKALHAHAHFTSKIPNLLVGMYVTCQVYTSSFYTLALKPEAFGQINDRDFVFIATKKNENHWELSPKEIIIDKTKTKQDVIPFTFKNFQPTPNTLIVHKNTYYLIAELYKDNTAHNH